MKNSYLNSVKKQMLYYKSLGDKAFEQLSDEHFFKIPNLESNSIALIVKHMVGNMLSRWTNFLTEDGEKPWRHRDQEFINNFNTKTEVLIYWEKGWDCFLKTINQLNDTQLEDVIYIRNQGHTVTEAINRQLCHYSYHIGQIVFLSKMLKNSNWKSLSIPKNSSENYNQSKFKKDKTRKHFTEDL